MSELERILEAITDWSHRGVDFALATVVGVRGSTYRGLAARQLVDGEGASVGTVSGGCLDTELRRIAGDVIRAGQARLAEFDLTADDEAVWGWGIGCNGATELLVEPASTAASLATHLAAIRAGQRPAALVHTLAGGRPGARAVVTHASVEGSLPAALVEEARLALEEGRHRRAEDSGLTVLIEVVGSPSRLIVCGAGHDAVPVVKAGAELGFEVIVVDDRRQFLAQERFPEAAALVHAEARELAKVVDLDRRSYVVVMSHNYLRDLEYLRVLVGSDVAYVGALGPGERLRRLLDDLSGDGVPLPEEVLARVHGPAGLDIGAEGPVEIAWSIMAEVLAVRRARTGGLLRARKGPVLR
jgi:xanthine/CO dehydrogenase XdhC/CoxF family maturation factor